MIIPMTADEATKKLCPYKNPIFSTDGAIGAIETDHLYCTADNCHAWNPFPNDKGRCTKINYSYADDCYDCKHCGPGSYYEQPCKDCKRLSKWEAADVSD